MRLVRIAIAATLFASAPALACDDEAKPARSRNVSYVSGDLGGEHIPIVSRGDRYAVACDDIDEPGADVRVVMALANQPGETETGYAAVMATNSRVIGHGVKFVVPDVPDLANHTVNVTVYVTDEDGTHSCDAGRVRIV